MLLQTAATAPPYFWPRWRMTTPQPPPGAPGGPPQLLLGLAVGGIFVLLLGVAADFAGAFQLVGWMGLAGLVLLSFAIETIRRLQRDGRLRLLVQPQSSAEWRTAALANSLVLLSVLLLVFALVSPTIMPVSSEPTAASPEVTQTPGSTTSPSADRPVGACQPFVGSNEFSHARFARFAGDDVDVDVETGGYVQQRFFAASEYISAVAVIVSRPPVSGQVSFDPQAIGRVRLSMFRADDEARNVEPVPLALVGSGAEPDLAGVVQQAGANHQQTVFRLCPVAVEKGQRFAFRVTNEEPGVVLAFSLSVQESPETSMDIIGTRSGEDRVRINYHQVAGYVCSTLQC